MVFSIDTPRHRGARAGPARDGLRRRPLRRARVSGDATPGGRRGPSPWSGSPRSSVTSGRGEARGARTETPTAEGAADAIGCTLSQIVKSLVLVCDGAPVVALVPGDRKADTGKVARLIGARRVTVASAAEVLEATGFQPGGVARSRSSAWRPCSSTARCSGTASCGPGRAPTGTSSALSPPSSCASRAVASRTSRSNHHNLGQRTGERRRPDAGDREDLDERRARRLGGCDRPRRRPRAPLRHRRVRGHPRLRDPARAGRVPPRGPPPAAPRQREAPLHGHAVHGRGAPDRRPTTSCARTACPPATSGRSSSSATARSASTRAATRSRR